MKFFRTVLNALAVFICATSIVGLVYLFTLQATIMDRTVVKGWLTDSKIYEGNLIASLIQPADTPSVPNESVVNTTPTMMKTALNATFTPDFIRVQVEEVIDNAYDWAEGKKPTFTFSIPIDQKRETFIQQLSKTLEPQVAALPVCGTIQGVTCRPASLSVEQLTAQMTAQSIDESGMFATPITPATFSQQTPQPNSPSLTQLPALRQIIDLLFILLPIVIILSAAAAIFAASPNQRLVAAIRLSRRVFFGMLFTLVPALIIMLILNDNDFGLSKMFAAQIGDLIVPLIKIVIIDVASHLALFSGIVTVISGTAWIALHFWRQKNTGLVPPKSYTIPTQR